MAGTQFLRLGRETEKGVDLPIGEEIQRPQFRIGDPINVLVIQADAGSHQDQQRRWARRQANALAFEIGDPANALAREEFVASGVQARDDDDRNTGVQGVDLGQGRSHREIEFASPQRLYAGGAGDRVDKADISKALRAQ